MANSVRAKLALKFILVAANLCFLVIYVSGWTAPLIQSNKKSIIRRVTYAKYPVEISFHLKGQPLTNETLLDGFRSNDFDADGDWLKDLTIKIKNTSGKTITWMLLNLHFPEVTKDGATALHQIFLGVDPDAPFSRPELRLLPNQTLEIPLNAKYDDIKHLVNVIGSGMPIEGVSKLLVEFHAALFDDETRFEAGTTYRRNSTPGDPQKWIKIND
jgi:hypothetical protein